MTRHTSSISCSWARRGLLAAVPVAFACNPGEPAKPVPEPAKQAPQVTAPAPAPAPRRPAKLDVDLPAGVEASLDGAKPWPTPLAGIELEPGKHTLKLITACQQVELPIEAFEGETTRIDRERAKGLRLTTLEISTRDLDGKPLAHTVALDEQVVARGEGASTVTVPGCKHRMKIASDGLGAFIEDVELTEPTLVRELVLTPGPDMVRIHGGPFTLGPPASASLTEARWDLRYPRKDVVFATFDMDRTEVTAAQFHACRVSGRCTWDWGRDFTLEKWPRFPIDDQERICTTKLDYAVRTPIKGREDHPMNCVSYYEAEMYCAAVGKRLPTAAEWEYASRSRKSDYYCPWAPPKDVSKESPICKGSRAVGIGTNEVCHHPDHITEQGLCDMPWNVTEIVVDEHVPAPGMPNNAITTRGGWNEYYQDDWLTTFRSEPPPHGTYLEPRDQDVLVGFRCVRDANPRATDGIKE